jgi:phosphonate transport system ATP-binding protein
MIEVRNLAKAYGKRTVLHDISLSVRAGEFLVVLGPSGAGKSTLLRCLNGLIHADAGSIVIDGKIVNVGDIGNREQQRPIAMIFQQHNLVKRLSVLKNVLVGRMAGSSSILSLLQLFRDADIEIALDALRQVELEHKAQMRADQLSGGEQQRVGIARALAQRPAVILADEPVASLDPATAERVLADLHRICREDGITAVVSLHQVELARHFADRIVGLSAGRMVFDGPAAALSGAAVARIYGAAPPRSAVAAE